MTLILILILNYVLAKRQPCAIMEDPICTKLMKDTYSMTIEDYNSLKPLQKLIMQDNLNCINENLCPKQLDPITNKENVCINGVSIELNCPCKNIALCSFIPLMDLGAHINASGNDIWGWTQYDENDKYIGYYTLAGTSDGTSIVDITDPYNPNVLAFVQSNVDPLRFIIWRDIKTYKDFAFVVTDTTPTSDSSDSNSEDNYNVVGAMQGLLNGIDKETEENYKYTIKLNIINDLLNGILGKETEEKYKYTIKLNIINDLLNGILGKETEEKYKYTIKL
eukprot:58458_1